MRKIHESHEDGETRERSGFLWIPASSRFDGRMETRWLENARWLERYYKNQRNLSGTDGWWLLEEWLE